MMTRFLLAGLALVGAWVAPCWAEARFEAGFEASDAGMALMRQADQQTKSLSENTRYRMLLESADGRVVQERRLQFFFHRLDNGERVEERSLIRFEEPASLRGTGLLVVDEGASANDLWLYMPANRRMRRLAGAEKSNWFMGTEFTHEDFEDFKLEHYLFSVPAPVECEFGQCLTVHARPGTEQEQKASGYGGKTYWLESNSLYPVRIDYFGHDGSHVKRLDTSGLQREGQYWRPTEYVMRNLLNGRVTRMLVDSRELDQALDPIYTSQRFLRGG